MNAESAAHYRANRALVQSYHPHLLACLPEECPYGEDGAESSGAMERVSFQDVGGYTSRDPKYVVVYGGSDGRWLQEFYRKHTNTLKSLIFVEPDAVAFTRRMARFSWIPLLRDERVRWFVGASAGDVQTRLLSDTPEIASWGIHAWFCDSVAAQFEEERRFFLDLLRRALANARDNARIQIERGVIMQSNIIRNLPAIARSMTLDAVARRFVDVPAAIVGAGPSLNRTIDALREASPGVLIVASDTALRPLLRRGIQPHIVASCDPLQLNCRHFLDIPSLGEAILAYLPETNAGILEQFTEHPRLLCLHDLQSKLLQRAAGALGVHKTFRRRMNVGYCAFILAQEMGCSPIILTGMDLAVSPGGLSHADGTANASVVAVAEDGKLARLQGAVETGDMPMVSVEAYGGGQTLTFAYFYQILLALEQSIASMPGRVIDATEGGAKKHGAEQMTLRDALRRYAPSGSISVRLNAVLSPSARSSIPGILAIVRDVHLGLQATRAQLQIGTKRLCSWSAEIGKNSPPVETLSRQAEFLMNRWSELLSENSLDVGVDIGLARWRYAAQQVEPPEGVAARELAEWWSAQLREWFDGLGRDLELFDNLFALVRERLQTVLTSSRETQ